MNVYLATLGCRLNEAELSSWERRCSALGHSVVDRPEEAQVLILNTCAVTAEAARKSRKLATRLRRRNREARLVVTGCYATLNRELTPVVGLNDLVIENSKKDQLIDVALGAAHDHLNENVDATYRPLSASERRTRAFVKVQDGCRNRCTFCIVTKARGEERSRSASEIVDEVNTLHRIGYQEAVLTGVHLGGYGSDIGSDLYLLVTRLLEETKIPRLRLSSIEPWDIPNHFWRLWQNTRLCPHLHLPLQSGSDVVLKRMARRSTTKQIANLVLEARSAIPDLVITSDIIIGFPGETDEDFQSTLAFAERIGFGHLHIFPYSPREGTAAARMSGQVDTKTKKQRNKQMHQLAERLRHATVQRFLGQTRPILWEQVVDQGGTRSRWSGLTDNYLRCEVTVPSTLDLRNRLIDGRLEHFRNGAIATSLIKGGGEGQNGIAAIQQSP